MASQGVRYVGNSIENFYDDDLVLIGSNLPHCWINASDQPQSSTAVVVYLKEQFIDKAWMQSAEFDGIRKLLELSDKGIKFDKTVALRLREKCLELVKLTSLEKAMLLLQILNELTQTTTIVYYVNKGFHIKSIKAITNASISFLSK